MGMIMIGSTHSTGLNTSGFKVRFHPRTIFISEPNPTQKPLLLTVNVLTRTGAGKTDSVCAAHSSSVEEVSISSLPPAARTRSHLASYRSISPNGNGKNATPVIEEYTGPSAATGLNS